MKTRRQYDDEFKRMAVELADAKGSLKATADEWSLRHISLPDGAGNE